MVRGTPISDPALVFVLRVLTSLSAAAVAAVIPGFIDLSLKTSTVMGIRAGGALAVFALVFAVNPPALVQSEETRIEAAMLANKATELYDDAGKPDWYFSVGRAYLYANDFSRARKELQVVPSPFWHGAGRVLEAASLVGLAQTSDITKRDALLAEARTKLNEGVQQDPVYWRGILKAGRTDIHIGYDKPRALLAELVAELSL